MWQYYKYSAHISASAPLSVYLHCAPHYTACIFIPCRLNGSASVFFNPLIGLRPPIKRNLCGLFRGFVLSRARRWCMKARFAPGQLLTTQIATHTIQIPSAAVYAARMFLLSRRNTAKRQFQIPHSSTSLSPFRLPVFMSVTTATISMVIAYFVRIDS